MKPCICGTNRATVMDENTITRATSIECLGCHRLVGGLNRNEAIAMWNASVMAILPRPRTMKDEL
jgi:hypothetical protein